MISVVQRVSRASVMVGERATGEIGNGLLALVAVVSGDDEKDVHYTADRLQHLRIFPDEEGKMNLSVEDVGGDLLLVSQFTLAADTTGGRRPSFSRAAPPEEARRLFDSLVDRLERVPLSVQTGEFAATMRVNLVNNGPVTLILDSRDKRRDDRATGR